MIDSIEVELAMSPSAPTQARHALTTLCTARLDDELMADATLLVSELVTNAFCHGIGPIRLRAHVDDQRLLVEVIDGGQGFEHRLRRTGIDEVGGWGLGIVEALAGRWGVHEGSTHVWFELERRGPRLGEERAPGTS